MHDDMMDLPSAYENQIAAENGNDSKDSSHIHRTPGTCEDNGYSSLSNLSKWHDGQFSGQSCDDWK